MLDFSPLFIGEVPSKPFSADTRRRVDNFSPLFIGEVPSNAHFAPCFQQDMSLARRISSKTPNLQETPGGLRKSGPLVRCLYVCQGFPPR